MRVVFDIHFGTTGKQTHFGIFDFDTNTLEYFSQTKLEGMLKKGYVVQDLAVKKEEGTLSIDIINTTVHVIPQLHKQDNAQGYGVKQGLVMTQPIYLKNLKTGLYFNYQNAVFTYQKRKKGDEWGVMFAPNMPLDNAIQLLYQMAPYLLCGDVFKLRVNHNLTDVHDYSALAQLSNTKCIELMLEGAMFKNIGAVRMAGLMQNLKFGSLFNGVNSEKDNLNIIDLSNIYTDKNTDINSIEFFDYAHNIPANTLLVCPNISNFVENSKAGHLRGNDVNKNIDWINLGVLPKNCDYISEAKKQLAKQKLMGKDIKQFIFYVIIQ